MAKKQTPIVKNDELTKVHHFEEIFSIVEHNGTFQIAVGNKLVDEQKFTSLKAAQDYISSKPWKLLINVTCLIYDMSKKA